MNCHCPPTLVPTPVGMKRKKFLRGIARSKKGEFEAEAQFLSKLRTKNA
jgi:hypothetical protein